MPNAEDPIIDRYLARADRYDADRQRCETQSRRLSYTRLAVFLASAAVVLSAFPGPVPYGAARLAAGGAGLVLFGALVAWHARVEERERRFASLSRVNREAAARVRRDWHALPTPTSAGPGLAHAFAGDLDLFGHASVFQLLGWVATEPGRAVLARWLAEPAAPEEIRARQEAVRELASHADEREQFAALGRLVEPGRGSLDELIAWAEAGPWFATSAWIRWGVPATTAALFLLAAGQAVGVLADPWWLVPLGVSVVLLAAYGKRTHRTFTRVFTRSGVLQGHEELFARIGGGTFQSARLQALQAALAASGPTAAREIARLALIGQFAEFRRVAILHPLVVLFTVCDLHVLAWLEAWQRRTSPHLRRWYEVLGEFDALSAIAALAHENPSWAYPVIDERADALTASAVGHPLIPADRRVANDVVIGPRGTFVMVTGSNMSGKSTLLRAIGVNVVLAQAGAPVCAARLAMPPLGLCTSMRVQDSLEEGVSYFMAALQRLKLVVDMARASGRERPMLLYLLDEVLQGTNTAERQVAVRRIVRHLLDLPTIGVVTTHDLELAASEDLVSACHSVHFAETVEHGDAGLRLEFDYRLKPGIATSVNALKLLTIVGLDT